MTLWDRIASSLATSCSKVDDGDTDEFVSLALDHVRADPAQAGRNDRVSRLLTHLAGESLAWRQGWTRYIASHSYAIVAHGRLAWVQTKEAKADERQPKGGAA